MTVKISSIGLKGLEDYRVQVQVSQEKKSMLMSGPPGCGKSLFAETFPSIMPALTKNEQLEVMSLFQFYPQLTPYRSPHHSSSSISCISGGTIPKPDEISLARHGVLFLDEIAEFPKKQVKAGKGLFGDNDGS